MPEMNVSNIFAESEDERTIKNTKSVINKSRQAVIFSIGIDSDKIETSVHIFGICGKFFYRKREIRKQWCAPLTPE